MRIPIFNRLASRNARASGMTLVEIMIATGIGAIVIGVVMALSIFGMRSFVALGNYTELDARSRNALDRMSREMRQATAVVAFQNNGSSKFLTLTNAIDGIRIRYSWDESSRNLVCRKTGQVTGDVYLTGCDRWDFSLYQRTPQQNKTNTFFETTDETLCKLINMSWKCSRTMLGKEWHTESVQTAQIVLRNKQ